MSPTHRKHNTSDHLAHRASNHIYPTWFRKACEAFQPQFDAYVASFDSHLPLGHLMRFALYPGRRIRPGLYYALCEAQTGTFPAGADTTPALAIELFHAASIILDDIADREECRRDKLPFYRQYGIDIATLASHWLVGKGCELLSRHADSRLLMAAWNEHYLGAIDGEAYDIFPLPAISPFDQHRVSLRKTTSFFSFLAKALQIVLDESHSPDLIPSLETFGECFQISNDVADLLFLGDSARYRTDGKYPLRPSFGIVRLLAAGLISRDELFTDLPFSRLLQISAAANRLIPDMQTYLWKELEGRRTFIREASISESEKHILLSFISHSIESTFWLHHHV